MDKLNQRYELHDKVLFHENVGRDGRRFATSVKLVERAAPKPKPTPAAALSTGTGIVKGNTPGRDYLFICDELNDQDIFVPAQVVRQSGVQLQRGDRVSYTTDVNAPAMGRCPAAVTIEVI
jgi:cold shock CspA family protein